MTVFSRIWLPVGFALFLTACGDNSARYLLDPPVAQDRVALRVSTVEIRDVVLPSYAAASEILMQEADGSLRPVSKAVWADDPVQAVTLALARNLETVSTAKAAAEPWPLLDPAQVRVEVRIDRMVAQADGTFQLAGQFSIASPDGIVRESLNRFQIEQPMDAGSAGAVAAATSASLTSLARQIAARLRR